MVVKMLYSLSITCKALICWASWMAHNFLGWVLSMRIPDASRRIYLIMKAGEGRYTREIQRTY